MSKRTSGEGIGKGCRSEGWTCGAEKKTIFVADLSGQEEEIGKKRSVHEKRRWCDRHQGSSCCYKGGGAWTRPVMGKERR